MWKYGVNAFQGNWTKVLAAKWVLASVSQGDIQSEVIRMKTVAYTPKMRDEILKNLKAYADELNNRYQVQSVPEFEPLLTLITVLDEKEYKPSVWSV